MSGALLPFSRHSQHCLRHLRPFNPPNSHFPESPQPQISLSSFAQRGRLGKSLFSPSLPTSLLQPNPPSLATATLSSFSVNQPTSPRWPILLTCDPQIDFADLFVFFCPPHLASQNFFRFAFPFCISRHSFPPPDSFGLQSFPTLCLIHGSLFFPSFTLPPGYITPHLNQTSTFHLSSFTIYPSFLFPSNVGRSPFPFLDFLPDRNSLFLNPYYPSVPEAMSHCMILPGHVSPLALREPTPLCLSYPLESGGWRAPFSPNSPLIHGWIPL